MKSAESDYLAVNAVGLFKLTGAVGAVGEECVNRGEKNWSRHVQGDSVLSVV